MSSMPEPQAGGSIPGGTGSSQLPIAITTEQEPSVEFQFKKTFQLYTAGYQFVDQSNSTFYKGTANVDWTNFISDTYTQVISTPLSAIVPDMTQYYMTVAEWNQLPLGSYATRCCIKVTPLGYRLPFTTNEATSTFANSQTLVQIVTNVGINTVTNCLLAQYTTDAADLTRPTGQVDTLVFGQLLYGSATDIGCNMGIPRHHNRYVCLVTPKDSADSGSTPNLLNHVKIMNVNDVKGTPVINYAYNFKNGIIKFPSNSQSQYIQDGAYVSEGNNPIGWYMRVVQSDGITNPRRQMLIGDGPQRHAAGTAFPPITSYATQLEKADTCSRNYNDRHTPDRPPLVCFGCMPVQSNPALAPVATFADVVVQWEVSTCLYVTYHPNYITPSVDIYYLKSYDPNIGQHDYTQASMRADINHMYISNRKVYSAQQIPNYSGDLILGATGTPVLTRTSDVDSDGMEVINVPSPRSTLKKRTKQLFQ
jgi:hypothetical protein